ncbi:beta-1,3-galactosyltransferase brn-like [Pecten maximus]|uniref:beta-1,3-galactosyltransferase brn-like n=1 Tax=Pecten maximus TaxID=6579 RepID=UPI001458E458|nr:beta-1,3-galactosyltransferase brn-like [Pecten maximus]
MHPPVPNNHPVVVKELPFQKFQYPLEINMKELVKNITKNGASDIAPLNVYPYSYLISSESLCKPIEKVFLLFIIKSAAENFDQRQAIRETWAKQAYFQKDVIRHAFLLARSRNKTTNDLIFMENWMHKDIVKMSFIDGYFNNTYKTTGGINWSVKYCPTSRFVMLVDDDVYVSTYNLLEYLHTVPENISDSFFAGAISSDVPQRGIHQKWYMPVKEYPFKRYPPFLSAGSVIMTMDYVKRLQIAMQFTKSFKFDDVFLGIVAYKLGVKPIHVPRIKMIKFISYRNHTFKIILAAHGYGTPNELRTAWYHNLRTKLTNDETILQRSTLDPEHNEPLLKYNVKTS